MRSTFGRDHRERGSGVIDADTLYGWFGNSGDGGNGVLAPLPIVFIVTVIDAPAGFCLAGAVAAALDGARR